MTRRSTTRRPWSIRVRNFAQIGEVDVKFGDLTLLIGPQATGKSLVLQLLKLAVDGRGIVDELRATGFEWKGAREFLDVYLGEGLGGGWSARSQVEGPHGSLRLSTLTKPRPARASWDLGEVFYVPAHRALVLADGWPRPFRQFTPDTPFVVRKFSQELNELAHSTYQSPQSLPRQLDRLIDDAIFHGGRPTLDVKASRRRVVLEYPSGLVPAMAWTAGQREFVPLLLGLMHLMPGGDLRVGAPSTVIIEEPEMGLHPKAIMAVMLFILELLRLKYRVILSTHSPMVVDVVWALTRLKLHRAPWTAVAALFDVTGREATALRGLATRALKLEPRVYYLDFKGTKVRSIDISSLDPGSRDAAVAGWGGLTRFSGKVGEVVASAVNAG